MNSTHLYMADSGNGTQTNYTIYAWSSDPVNPPIVGSFADPDDYIKDLELMWPETTDTVLLSRFSDNLIAHNVENSGFVTWIDNYSCTEINDVTVIDEYALCVGTNPLVTDGMFILSLDLIGGFTEEGTCSTPGDALHIDTEWPYVYIGDGDPGLSIAKIISYSTINYNGSTPLVTPANDVAVNGTTLCVVARDAGVETFDVATNMPEPLGRMGVANRPFYIKADGDYLFASENSSYYPAIKSLDITDPENIFIADEYLSANGALDFMDYSNGRLVAIFGGNYVEYLNASDPENITLIQAIFIVDTCRDVNLYNDYLYVTAYTGSDYRMLVFHLDAFNPPDYMGDINVPGSPKLISFSDEIMFFPVDNDVFLYSLADPALPQLIAEYSTLYTVYNADAKDGLMYVACMDRLEVADISNPIHPEHVGSVLLTSGPPFYLTDIELDGQIAYVGGLVMDLFVCNVWPPDNPTINDATITLNHANTIIDLADDYLYGGSFSGLHVYDLTQ